MDDALNILIIDDDEIDRMAVMRALKVANMNARVWEASDAAQGIELLKAHEFDCALLDYRLPDRDGLDALRDIREIGGGVPVIMLTGQGSEQLAVDLMKAGASDYLVKGELSLEHLSQSVRSAVRVHQAEKAAAAAHRQLEEQRAAMLSREKKLRAQAEAANSAKDRFLSVLSHELRTPLTPVLSLVELLQKEDCLPPEAKEAVEVIHRNVELEARLIDDLLDLTRITRGTLQLNREPADAHHLLRQAADIWQSDIAAKNIQWQLNLSAQHSVVQADPGRLQQIFWNLIRNAVKFTATGGRVEVRTANPEPNSLAVEIIDTGIGIDADSLKRIFAAFEQGQGAALRRTGGLGLGLAISRALVEAHGGTLEGFSAGRDQGATFRVTLPASEAPPAAARSPGRQGQMKGRRILLVDDHVDTSRAMKRLLTRMGHEVDTADSVRTAVEAARQHPFDLLISDIGLPDGTGLELIQQIRQIQPIDGIALSGYGMEDDIRRSKEAGFVDHLTKPVNFKRLESLIEEAMAGKEGAKT
jgi:signal transduction histidine kinase